jgi:hypothetical protein
MTQTPNDPNAQPSPSQTPEPTHAPAEPPRRAVGLAVAALILGLCGLIPFLGLLLAPIGLLLGIVALISNTTAHRMAIAGVVLAIVTVSVQVVAMAVLVTSGLSPAREMAHRGHCMANLNSIGKAVVVYQGEYNDEWPWMAGHSWHQTNTGTNQSTAPADLTARMGADRRCVTSLMFLLVPTGVAPAAFVCPSDEATPDASPKTNGRWDWDFSSHENVSYSWQVPLSPDNPDPGYQANGVSNSSDGGMVVMGDKSPDYDDTGSNAWARVQWSADPPPEAMRKGISQNHGSGEVAHVLYAGFNVGRTQRADCGVDNDNIYLPYGADPSKQGVSIQQKQDGIAPPDVSNHNQNARDDSFLLGPLKAPYGQ